jgi:hypothetical protein
MLPIVCFSSLALLGFVALAVDLGVVAVARTQSQNIADSAAMAGARALNGDKTNNNNYGAAGTTARAAAQANEVLGKTLTDSQLALQFGSYTYNDAQQKFIVQIPKSSTDNWSLCKATATASGDTYFAKVLGISSFGTSTSAVAVHRPRDVAIVLDFSGSMRFGSLPGIGHTNARLVSGGSPASGSNNPESVFPRFGHYSSASAGLQRTSPVTLNGNVYDLANFTEVNAASDNRPPIVSDFYQHAYGSAAAPAFTSAGDGDSDGFVSGDRCCKSNTAAYAIGPGTTFTYTAGTSYPQTSQQLLNVPSESINSGFRDWRWELDGYAALGGNVDGSANYSTTVSTNTNGKLDYTTAPYYGYVQGPRYWGKTFFHWPPDPRYPLGTVTGTQSADRQLVQYFLREFGYSAAEVGDGGSAYAISQNWPWASQTALQTTLQGTLAPGSTTQYLNSDHPIYQRIVRLHNRPKADWRKKFFFKSDGVTPADDNSGLWDGDGDWRSPIVSGSAGYKINYQAILKWLFTEGPNPFPPRLRGGRIVYYDVVPDHNDNGLNSRWWNTFPLTDYNERFWKEYIDYALGLRQTGSNTWDVPSTPNPNIARYCGYGDDFTWGTKRRTANSSLTTDSYGLNTKPYMHYQENVERPRLRCWFGPMTMVDFLGNYNMGSRASNQSYWWWPGTAHEAPLYACKIGIRAALQDIEKNHPNDHVSLTMFCVPRTSASDTTNARRFNHVRAPMGRDYRRMIDSLWFPSYTLDNPGTEIRIYDIENNLGVPRAMGGTCYSMGLMLAYNQFSSRLDLRTYNPAPAPVGDAGGLGRRGAQKMIIFETDGLPNNTATATLVDGGPYNGYYRIRFNSSNPSGSEYPSVSSTGDNDSTVTSQIFSLCQQITALDTATPPGYSTTRKPALIHCIGFGAAVQPGSATQAGALATLAQMETIGNIPAAKRIGVAPYKTVYGSDASMIANLHLAVSNIMQDGVSVTLIE